MHESKGRDSSFEAQLGRFIEDAADLLASIPSYANGKSMEGIRSALGSIVGGSSSGLGFDQLDLAIAQRLVREFGITRPMVQALLKRSQEMIADPTYSPRQRSSSAGTGSRWHDDGTF